MRPFLQHWYAAFLILFAFTAIALGCGGGGGSNSSNTVGIDTPNTGPSNGSISVDTTPPHLNNGDVLISQTDTGGTIQTDSSGLIIESGSIILSGTTNLIADDTSAFGTTWVYTPISDTSGQLTCTVTDIIDPASKYQVSDQLVFDLSFASTTGGSASIEITNPAQIIKESTAGTFSLIRLNSP